MGTVPWPHLEQEQQDILKCLIEAWRSAPAPQRQKFLVQYRLGDPHPTVVHDGIPGGPFQASLSDLQMLHRAGLVLFEDDGYGSGELAPTPEAFEYYRDLQKHAGRPAQRLDEVVRRHLISTDFESRFPRAYRKWSEAEALLWSADSATTLTTIGHLLREAMQDLADELLELTDTPDAAADSTKIIQRIRTVFKRVQSKFRTGEEDLLEGLLTYWTGLNAMVQRQEHGAMKEGQDLAWDDARRVVLHACIVMSEIHRCVIRA